MTTAEFVAAFERIMEVSRERMETVGAEQYDLGGRQAFEDRTLERQFEEVREELYDAIVHCTALVIKLDRIEAASRNARG